MGWCSPNDVLAKKKLRGTFPPIPSLDESKLAAKLKWHICRVLCVRMRADFSNSSETTGVLICPSKPYNSQDLHYPAECLLVSPLAFTFVNSQRLSCHLQCRSHLATDVL